MSSLWFDPTAFEPTIYHTRDKQPNHYTTDTVLNYFYRTWLYIWVARRVFYKKQELFTVRKHLSSPRCFGRVRDVHLFSFCVVLLCVFTFWVPCLWCPSQFPHGSGGRFVFASSCWWEGTCLVCVVCVCLRVVVSDACCVVFLFIFVLCTDATRTIDDTLTK